MREQQRNHEEKSSVRLNGSLRPHIPWTGPVPDCWTQGTYTFSQNSAHSLNAHSTHEAIEPSYQPKLPGSIRQSGEM
jgi:hypothetical protein